MTNNENETIETGFTGSWYGYGMRSLHVTWETSSMNKRFVHITLNSIIIFVIHIEFMRLIKYYRWVVKLRAWHNLFFGFIILSFSIIISSRISTTQKSIYLHYITLFLLKYIYKTYFSSSWYQIEIFPKFTKLINFQLATIIDWNVVFRVISAGTCVHWANRNRASIMHIKYIYRSGRRARICRAERQARGGEKKTE